MKVSLTDVSFIDTLPSILAASVIAAARRAFGLSPIWSENLEMLTGYREDQLGHLTTLLLFHHGMSVNSSDEGYCSFSSSPTSPSGGTTGGLPVAWVRNTQSYDVQI